jgi:plasmid stabilization system protein ParE
MYLIVSGNNRKARRERDDIAELMEKAAGSAASIFALEDQRGRVVGWRVQHNDLGTVWLERAVQRGQLPVSYLLV